MKAPFSFISDGSGAFTKALEAGMDLSAHALGYRSRRFTAIVENGEVTQINDEEGAGLTTISSADTVLSTLEH
jgi:peroxiredoxin